MASKKWIEEKREQYEALFPEWDDDKMEAMLDSLENLKDLAAKEKRKRKNK